MATCIETTESIFDDLAKSMDLAFYCTDSANIVKRLRACKPKARLMLIRILFIYCSVLNPSGNSNTVCTKRTHIFNRIMPVVIMILDLLDFWGGNNLMVVRTMERHGRRSIECAGSLRVKSFGQLVFQ